MGVRSYLRECIALEQLETALRLWDTEEDYISVITLAGAAEEILGKCLASQGNPNSMDALKADATLIHRHLFDEDVEGKAFADLANRARNSLKHFDPGQGPTVTLDAREEARDMLNRAIDNYWNLKASLTSAMRRFQEGRETSRHDGDLQ